MIRVLQLVTTRRPFYEQQVKALERNGVECTTVTVPGDMRGRSAVDYVRFYPRVLRAVAAGEFDLVHSNYGLTAPAALAQPVRPVVCSLWGSDVFGRYGTPSRACAGLADAVVTVSDEIADELDRDCHVIPHGVDTDQFQPQSREDAGHELGWDPAARHVLFPYDPSRPEKNYSRAERVVDGAAGEVDAPVELHAVHGVPHEQMPVYVNAADVLVLTSEYEGSPNTVKEALACNVSIVTTSVGDTPDLLDGVDGTHVCRSDDELVAGLVEALTSQERPDTRERAVDVGLQGMAEDLLAVYDSVLDRSVQTNESVDAPRAVR